MPGFGGTEPGAEGEGRVCGAGDPICQGSAHRSVQGSKPEDPQELDRQGLWAIGGAGLQLWLTSVSGDEMGGFPHHPSASSFFPEPPLLFLLLSLPPLLSISVLLPSALPRIMEHLALVNIYTFQVTAEGLSRPPPPRSSGSRETFGNLLSNRDLRPESCAE